ncbi:hypothetical protein AAW31_06855 [Nitrosomonas communis]|uniref:Uncharacterized protein n=1 Tax=Nitrosomonas communis TaxID=44574 RepID=A0A0F7KEM1_9PROT|nr:hypothetical protein AAW31_06855 [Nitrosomonas communis]
MPALQKFEAGGSQSFLNELERQALDQHLHKNLYLTAKKSRIMLNKSGVSATAKAASPSFYTAWTMSIKSQSWYRARLMARKITTKAPVQKLGSTSHINIYFVTCTIS